MEKEIKELRIEIDSLAQLVKSLKVKKAKEFDLSDIPPNYTIDDFIEGYEKGWIITDTIKERIFNINSKEIDKAYDSLILAKAWLGKLLGELGTTNPYGSGYKTKDDIVPTQDVQFKGFKKIAGNDFKAFVDMNHIEKVDWLRQEIEKIQKVTDPYKDFEENLIWEGFTSKAMYCLFNCDRHLSEARFWLGFELQRIKEEVNE